VALIVLKGSAEAKYDGEQQTMPRATLLEWTANRGVDGPRPLKHYPDWVAAPPAGAAAQAARSAVARLGKELQTGPVEKTVQAARKDTDAATRSLAVYSLGAVDDLSGLLATLADPQHAEVRRAAVIALRHWVGRDARHEDHLSRALGKAGYKANQAAIVMQLLHGFQERQLAQPETYEALIGYLQSDQLAVRELAAWHLYRLVPDGRRIAFDAAASAEERAAAQAAWRKLIPEGKLPGQKK
jgi:hypothetical protein